MAARCVLPFGKPESNSCGLDGTLLLHNVSCCSVNQKTFVGQSGCELELAEHVRLQTVVVQV